MKQNKYYIVLMILILSFLGYTYFKSPNFIEKTCYKKIKEGHITRVFLVHNIPWSKLRFEYSLRKELKNLAIKLSKPRTPNFTLKKNKSSSYFSKC